MMQVASGYIDDEHKGVARLQSDVARASSVLKH